mmetsp:Transcript_24494/g.60009  ORF Transcript_24494/g.60009 Transcript_24494/m.60009 type:complete len:82 (-) Transcript_24494:845-1090(-)
MARFGFLRRASIVQKLSNLLEDDIMRLKKGEIGSTICLLFFTCINGRSQPHFLNRCNLRMKKLPKRIWGNETNEDRHGCRV